MSIYATAFDNAEIMGNGSIMLQLSERSSESEEDIIEEHIIEDMSAIVDQLTLTELPSLECLFKNIETRH